MLMTFIGFIFKCFISDCTITSLNENKFACSFVTNSFDHICKIINFCSLKMRC